MNNYFTEMCSGSEAGSYLRLIDFVYHTTLGLRVIKKKKKKLPSLCASDIRNHHPVGPYGRTMSRLLWRSSVEEAI